MKLVLNNKVTCSVCGRVFDLLDESQGSEWYYGHDCVNLT